MAREQFTNNAATTLGGGGVNNSATSITVAAATGFPAAAQYRILIDSELMLVTAGAGTTTWTVQRGIEGTTAASHLNGAAVTEIFTYGAVLQMLSDNMAIVTCDGRLTLTSGQAVTTADVTGATNIYFTPARGNRIALWNGSLWVMDWFTEITIPLGTLASGKPYDLFAFDNSGSVSFDAPVAWTNNTTRATALSTQDGVVVKSGDATRRYIGTFYTTSTTTTEDSVLKRFLWNMYNRAMRKMEVNDSTTTWNVNLNGTWRQANANTANKVEAVIGVQGDDDVDLAVFTLAQAAASGGGFGVAIGEDSTTTASGDCWGMIGVSGSTNLGAPTFSATASRYVNAPAAGYHAFNWLEQSDNNSTTFFGNRPQSAGNSQIRSGIVGYIKA